MADALTIADAQALPVRGLQMAGSGLLYHGVVVRRSVDRRPRQPVDGESTLSFLLGHVQLERGVFQVRLLQLQVGLGQRIAIQPAIGKPDV